MPRWHNPRWDGGICKLWRWWRERKNSREKNEIVIHRDIVEN